MKHECKKCGSCCKTPPNYDSDKYVGVIIFPIDLKNISDYLNISKEKFLNEYCIHATVESDQTYDIYLLKAVNGGCIFLKEPLCSIHKAKPGQCRLAPHAFFAMTELWNHIPCVKRKNGEFITSKKEKRLLKSLIKGYKI